MMSEPIRDHLDGETLVEEVKWPDEPRTEAGKLLLDWPSSSGPPEGYAEFKRGELQAVRDLMCNHDILAIEAETRTRVLAELRERVEGLPDSNEGWPDGQIDRAAVLDLISELEPKP